MSAMLRARRCRPASTSAAALLVSSWFALGASTGASSRVRASAPAGAAKNIVSAASAATMNVRASIDRLSTRLSAERRDRRLVRERRRVLVREALAVLVPAAEISRPAVARRERRRDVLERRPVPVRAARDEPLVELDVFGVIARPVVREVRHARRPRDADLQPHVER